MRSLHPHEPRGYFGLVLWRPSRRENVGAVLRSAVVFGARFVVVAGPRYIRCAADTVDAANKLLLLEVAATEDAVREVVPRNCPFVALDLDDTGTSLTSYTHPVCAAYVFGPEDGMVPQAFGPRIQIPGASCLNLGTSAGIVMYDRIAKRARLHRRQLACVPGAA